MKIQNASLPMFTIFCLQLPEAVKFGSFIFYILPADRSLC